MKYNVRSQYSEAISKIILCELNQSELNHVFRVALQLEDVSIMHSLMQELLRRQNDDGGWPYKLNGLSVIGITATAVQLIFWTIYIAAPQLSAGTKNSYEIRIKKALSYIFSKKRKAVFWDVEQDNERKHGVLDSNHYISQALYYANNYEKELFDKELVLQTQIDLYKFYLEQQSKADGGWHEIGKLRLRVGVTSDAIRALLPNPKLKSSIMAGIQFLINNQHPIEGYWEGGNLDKIYDALKTLINSYWIIDAKLDAFSAIEKGITYLDGASHLELESLCDYWSVIIDYNNLVSSPNKEKLFF